MPVPILPNGNVQAIFFGGGTVSCSNPNGYQPGLTFGNGQGNPAAITAYAVQRAIDAKNSGAAGVLFYDCEGEAYPQSTYIGDPFFTQTTDPNGMWVAIPMFCKAIIAMGLRVGFTLRPTTMLFTPEGWRQASIDNGTFDAAVLKATNLNTKFGADIFYVDSGNYNNAGSIEAIAASFAANFMQNLPSQSVVMIEDTWYGPGDGYTGAVPFVVMDGRPLSWLISNIPSPDQTDPPFCAIYDNTVMNCTDNPAEARVLANAAYANGTALKFENSS